MSEGWVKLHRQIASSDLWKSEPFTRGQAWVDLILLANHKDGFIRARGIKIDVKRGQVGMSQETFAKRWSWSRGKVKRFLNELEMEQQIVQQKNNVTSLLSIVKYDEYQSRDTANSTASDTANGQQTVQQTDTNKNVKNNKNEKNNKISAQERFAKIDEVEWLDSELFLGFLEVRKKNGVNESITDHSVTLLLRELNENARVANKALERAIKQNSKSVTWAINAVKEEETKSGLSTRP